MAERLAVIRNPGYGARDFPGVVGLFFDVKLDESSGALICLFDEDAEAVLKHVYSVERLEGKSCWVEVDGNLVKFKRLANL